MFLHASTIFYLGFKLNIMKHRIFQGAGESWTYRASESRISLALLKKMLQKLMSCPVRVKPITIFMYVGCLARTLLKGQLGSLINSLLFCLHWQEHQIFNSWSWLDSWEILQVQPVNRCAALCMGFSDSHQNHSRLKLK